MPRFYFTFGIGQRLGGYCQPIEAKDYFRAREIMIENYNTKWCWQYDQEQWNQIQDRIKEKLMPAIIETEDGEQYVERGF